MKEEVDIMELIIERMPEKTAEQKEIKFYMLSHKSNCNYFLYEKYRKETTFLNTIIKMLMEDLGREIINVIYKDRIVKINKEEKIEKLWIRY